MKNRTSKSSAGNTSSPQPPLRIRSNGPSVYPFTAIVAQDEMKLAMILNVIDAKVGGVLIMGHRGTGKSTAVRALGHLLPEISIISECPYRCDPAGGQQCCGDCIEAKNAGRKRQSEKSAVRVVELPLGATEDRVCGTIDIEQALHSGIKRFEPGLLARANRGFLYIDEVNLLEDHLVDLLLDVSTTGVNNVEREGISVQHPASFVLIGSGNPEEGELRPQLLDRFGLFVEVKTEDDIDRRVEIVERRATFDSDPESFALRFADSQDQLRRKITSARKSLANVKVERSILRHIGRLCTELEIDGHRGELTITRAARALAAFEGRKKVNETDVRRVAVLALRHRLRRDALEETASAERIEQAMNKVLGKGSGSGEQSDGGSGDDSSSNGRQPSGKRAPSPMSVKKRTSAARNGNPAKKIETSPEGEIGADAQAHEFSDPIAGRSADLGLDDLPSVRSGKSSTRFQSGRQQRGNRSVYNQKRGRYARSVNSATSSGKIALDATLRAAAATVAKPWVIHDRHPTSEITSLVTPDALRFKLFKGKQGRLFIFAIDLSGSMALKRINLARVAMFGLLRQSYIHRDSVAIVGFRGLTAEVMLPPSKSILRARRVLESLPMGGGTPLSAGLACSLELAKRVGPKTGEIVLLIFTDGGANVSLRAERSDNRLLRRQIINSEIAQLGVELMKRRVATVVVDTRQGFRPDDTRKIAEALGAFHSGVTQTASLRYGD